MPLPGSHAVCCVAASVSAQDVKNDIFAFGLCMLELLTLKQLDPQHCVEVPELLQQVRAHRRREGGLVNAHMCGCLCSTSGRLSASRRLCAVKHACFIEGRQQYAALTVLCLCVCACSRCLMRRRRASSPAVLGSRSSGTRPRSC